MQLNHGTFQQSIVNAGVVNGILISSEMGNPQRLYLELEEILQDICPTLCNVSCSTLFSSYCQSEWKLLVLPLSVQLFSLRSAEEYLHNNTCQVSLESAPDDAGGLKKEHLVFT